MKVLRLPKLFYGTVSEVTRASRKAATQFHRGASLDDIAGADWFTLDDVDGHIMVGVHLPGEQYYASTLVDAVFDKSKIGNDDPEIERFFSELIARPWALAGCLGQEGNALLSISGRAARYLRAVARHWSTLNQPGRRYVLGLEPQSLWATASLVWGALGNEGVDPDRLREDVNDPSLDSTALPPLLKPYLGD